MMCPEYLVRVTYVELYNEDIRDLLAEPTTSQQAKLAIADDPIHGCACSRSPVVSMVVHVPGRLLCSPSLFVQPCTLWSAGPVVRGAREVVVSDPGAVLAQMSFGESNRCACLVPPPPHVQPDVQ